MRAVLFGFLGMGLIMAMADRASAQEDARAILDRALQAHGGAARLARLRAGQYRTTGTLFLPAETSFQQDASFQLPTQVREVLRLEVNGKQSAVTTVFDGVKAWIDVDGQTREVDGKPLAELGEMAHYLRVVRLTPLRDPPFQLSMLGETPVDGRAAAGIKVAVRGYRDIHLYFDKGNGLLVKSARRIPDAATGREVTEERFYREFQESNGVITPRKVVIYRADRKFMEGQVIEARLSERLDDALFGKP